MSDVPSWAHDKGWGELWRKPWTVGRDPANHPEFKQALWDRGFITPHFTRAEARSGDGVALPDQYRDNAQRHGFSLEDVRHRRGDHPLSPIDWYRSPAHNAAVGGVPNSQHLYGDATDWPSEGDQAGFNAVMEQVFEHGGIGTGAVSHRVMHVDNGPERRWTYPGA
jgi:zinc D-Ala-D-Ala carboxypeptidase